MRNICMDPISQKKVYKDPQYDNFICNCTAFSGNCGYPSQYILFGQILIRTAHKYQYFRQTILSTTPV